MKLSTLMLCLLGALLFGANVHAAEIGSGAPESASTDAEIGSGAPDDANTDAEIGSGFTAECGLLESVFDLCSPEE